MGVSDIFQCEALADISFQRAILQRAEQEARATRERLRRCDEVEQCRTRQHERAALRQSAGRNGISGAGGVTV